MKPQKKAEPQPVMSMKNLKGSDLGKLVADHSSMKDAMRDKMANLRAAKGGK